MILRSSLRFAQQQADAAGRPVYVMNGRYYKNLDDAPSHPANDGYYHVVGAYLGYLYDCYTVVPQLAGVEERKQ